MEDDILIARKAPGVDWWGIFVAGREVYSANSLDAVVGHLRMWKQPPRMVHLSLLSMDELVPADPGPMHRLFVTGSD